MKIPSVAGLALIAALSAAVVWVRQDPDARSHESQLTPPYPTMDGAGAPMSGAFEGRLPCVGCQRSEKIKVALVLYGDAATPTSYWLARVRVGEGDDRLVSTGVVQQKRGVSGYPDATVYQLDESAPAEFRHYWRLTESILLPLDGDMNPKAGNASWGYMLSRTK
jgi:hypothetical protein